MKSSLSFHERKHLEKLLQQQSSIKYIFDAFVRRIGVHMTGWSDSGSEGVWIRNANVEKAIEEELSQLRDDIIENVNRFSSDAWNRSNVKADDLVTSFIKDLSIGEVARKGMFARNEEVLKTFLNRKVEGLSLSDRIWNITGTAKDNIEHYLSSGLSTGRPATLISQDVRQLLKEPDRRFHRIRNADGKLVPSAPMEAYKPGRGIYRSSYKNALRLAVTNTNEIYRITDHERWQNMPFIKGVDIRRSPSNRGACPICDAMVGKYPKSFLFKGWHPWCICIATPILMEEDAFIDSLVNDDFSSAQYIQDIPKGPRSYLEDMLAKKNVSTKSYLFVDNAKYFDNAIPIKGNGSLNILHGVDKSSPDYNSVLKACKGFSESGRSVEILPRVHPKDKRYQQIFGKLNGTKYQGKSPDFTVDGKFFEHEGFRTKNPKRNYSNMMNRGLKQSSRIVIEDCGISTRYMKNNIIARIKSGQKIDEVWLLSAKGELNKVY
jgi:hypothetical protein